MASVKKKRVVDNDVEVLVDEVKSINRKEKKSRFSPVEPLTQSEKNLIVLKTRTVRPPKNLILLEEEPVDNIGVPKTRQMRSFPTEDFLSAKIKTANGTDYSNHFIEEHYNPGSRGKRRFGKSLKRIGVIDPSKRKKISLVNLGLDFGSKRKEAVQEVIDLTTNTEAKDDKNVLDNATDKLESNLVCRRLVPYSSSEDESSDDVDEDSSSSESSLDEEEDSTKISRQYLISEGLNEEKFKFQHKTITPGTNKKLK